MKTIFTIEEWRPIPGYEGYYEASTFGRIRSVQKKGKSRIGKILRLKKEKNGYLSVHFRWDGNSKYLKVHRLVAITWIPNPYNYPCINHKDEDKTNNFVFINPDGSVNPEKSNLEWCDWSYNANYGTRNKRIGEVSAKIVLQYTLEGVLVKEWVSASEAARCVNGFQGPISNCCRGEIKTAYGYIWRYK